MELFKFVIIQIICYINFWNLNLFLFDFTVELYCLDLLWFNLVSWIFTVIEYSIVN